MPGHPTPDVSRETVGRAVFGDRYRTAVAYDEILRSAGVERGLVGPREVPRMWERHVLNCAVAAPAVPQSATVVDVGSGAGLPGLLLAVARPDLAVVLLDPLLRRTTFLREVVERLALANVEVLRGRAEELAGSLDADVVTARAVAPLERLAGWCLPLVRPGGSLLAWKGERAAAELRAAEPALRRLGAGSWQVEEHGHGVVDPPVRLVRVVMPAASAHAPPARPARRSTARPGAAHGRDRTDDV